MIIVIDFGSQVSHLISRRIRELNVYSELVPASITAEEIEKIDPEGIILSGGPSSVYQPSAPLLDDRILKLNIPILGICYGHQLLAKIFGGKVVKGKGEYGKTTIRRIKTEGLLNGLDAEETTWMSHSDFVEKVPSGFEITSLSENNYISSMENLSKKIFSVQFHPEVSHTPKGMKILDNFLLLINAKKDWYLENFITRTITEIKKEVGSAKVLMGVSGGVDSTVAAELIRRAIGDNLYCVFVNNGLLRADEFEEVSSFFKGSKFNFHTIDASDIFLSRLKGIIDPEEKRKIIGKTFIEVFEKKAKELGDFDFLGQGTIYPDRIESAQPSDKASVIKSHHNVGGLPEKMNLRLLEPLKDLYKDEVRKIGSFLGINDYLLTRHPFPGPGLAIRIVGEVTPTKLTIVRKSDKILREELTKEQWYQRLWQSFTALLDIKTVGVMGDERSYQYPVILRCVDSIDAMTAQSSPIPITFLQKIASRIVNEVEEVNRVLYDLTDKPPATIEYE